MDTISTIMERRSVRKYRQDPLKPEDMRHILEAGRQAPTAANRQPVHIVVVTDAEQRRRVAEACNGQLWMADAACILVAAGAPQITARWYKVDAAITLENIVLAARSLGYGTCWIGAFDPDKVRDLCGIPSTMEVVACMPLGVPESFPGARPRKEFAQLFSADRYGEPLTL